jgi:hypothetical protein
MQQDGQRARDSGYGFTVGKDVTRTFQEGRKPRTSRNCSLRFLTTTAAVRTRLWYTSSKKRFFSHV